MRKGRAHIDFCLEVYAMLPARKRHFIHEHPAGSTAWDTNKMRQFMLRPEVDAVTLDMCTYGMTAVDERGEALVKKPTRLTSSAPEVLKRVEGRCTNRDGGEQHRHVQLMSGRAKAAQVYPRELCIRIAEGIAAQRKADQLGMRSRSIMNVEEMQQIVRNKVTAPRTATVPMSPCMRRAARRSTQLGMMCQGKNLIRS